ncbi:MAG: redox-sensitive bicupin YhaK (pirin superfamily) [Cellvibrionaceae bacterium]|jgi:redox-sensitive bicupin YhaK (pirin superfamily)
MAILNANNLASLTALEESLIAIVGGEISTPHCIDWNFISSQIERIEQAKNDWRNDQFEKVVGYEEEFIPSPK